MGGRSAIFVPLTDNQQFLADTGSPDTWVQGSQFRPPGPNFKARDSSTFVNTTKPWEFQYDGPDPKFIDFNSGYAARDTVAVGDAGATLSLRNETFAVAQKGGRPQFTQGIFGLTFDAHVSSYNAPVYVQQAMDRGLLRESRFGVHLRRAQDAKVLPAPNKKGLAVREHGGKITLGGVDESLFKGPVTYLPLQEHRGFWQVQIDGIYVNNKLVESTKNFRAVLDTGTTGILATPKQAQDFYQHLGGTFTGREGTYTVPCNTIINVKVKIGGIFVPIKAQDLNSGFSDKSHKDCISGLLGIKASNANRNGTYPSDAPLVIVLGVPFLLNRYTIFDYSHGGRIGLAELVDDGKLPAIAPIDIAQGTKP